MPMTACHRAPRLLVVPVLAAASLLFVSGTTAIPKTQQFISHTVGAGESVSLLCIEYYGQYAPAYDTAILLDNPHIKNINLIYPGQTLKLRNPDYRPKEGDSQPPVRIEKKVHAVQGVATYVEGEVTVARGGSGAAAPLTVNSIVNPGDIIETGPNAKVEMIINRETVVRMKENSRLIVEQLRNSEQETGKTVVRFPLGAVWTKMKEFRDKAARFELQLPTAVAGVHGTVYQTTVGADSSAEVKVFSGEVAVHTTPGNADAAGPAEPGEVSGPEEIDGPREVTVEEWTVIVKEMHRVRIGAKGALQATETFSRNPSDAWERWNEERDKRIAELFARVL